MSSTAIKKTVHFTDQYLLQPTHPVSIILIGCGGTGSLILSRLARLDAALRQLHHPGLYVTVYDGDLVEQHNIGRQNFTLNDLGKNKALALVEKINFAFNLRWEAYDTFFKINETKNTANIMITATDDAQFRMQFHAHLEVFKGYSAPYCKPLYWLDTGNGRDFGQVILSTIREIQQPQKSKYKTQTNLPSVVDIFGDLTSFSDSQTQGMESCSFADSIRKQDLFINDAIALNACTFLWKLFTQLVLVYHGVIINQTTLKQQSIKIK